MNSATACFLYYSFLKKQNNTKLSYNLMNLCGREEQINVLLCVCIVYMISLLITSVNHHLHRHPIESTARQRPPQHSTLIYISYLSIPGYSNWASYIICPSSSLSFLSYFTIIGFPFCYSIIPYCTCSYEQVQSWHVMPMSRSTSTLWISQKRYNTFKIYLFCQK